MLGPELASTRTTAVGVMMIAIVVLTAGVALLDGDPTTNVDWNSAIDKVVLILAGMGLFFSRDSRKSSQDVGIRR